MNKTLGRWNRRRILGVAAAGTAFLAACRGRTTNSGSATTEQPQQGGTVTVRQLVDPFDWDVTYLGKNIPNRQGFQHAYGSLLRFKGGPGVKYEDLILQPGLAERWETPDSQTYIFHMRPGVKFASLDPVSGRALSSADVKFSYEYQSRIGQFGSSKLPASQNAWMFEGVNAIETPDPATAVVRLDKPFVPFLNYSASWQTPIVPHEIYDVDGNFKNRLIGTGAWQLDTAASQKGSRWVWKRNPNYWDTGKPYIDQITWVIVPDDSAALAAFQTKQLDIMPGPGGNITPQVVDNLKIQRPDAVIDDHISVAPWHLYMLVSQPPLNDLRVRQAISLSFDRDEFVRVMANGKGGWAMAGAFPDTFSQDEIKGLLKQDLAQAKSLLEASGHGSGLDLEFIYPGNSLGDGFIQAIQLLQSQLKRSGINLVFKSIDKQDWLARKQAKKYTITTSTKDLAEDIDSYIYAVFYPGSVANYGDVDDPALTTLLDASRREYDPSKRREIIRQAARRVNVDQAWALAVYYPNAVDIWQPRLRNYAPTFASASGWPLESSWLAS
jgi:peptide/nickel transport system substrate-binding protein